MMGVFVPVWLVAAASFCVGILCGMAIMIAMIAVAVRSQRERAARALERAQAELKEIVRHGHDPLAAP